MIKTLLNYVMKKSYLMLLLVAMFALVACDNNERTPQRSENDIIVDNIIAQCKGFETEDITQYISGEWKQDASLIYNEDWSAIKAAHQISGNYRRNIQGRASFRPV